MAKAKIAQREEARIAAEQRPEEDDELPAPPDGGYGWVVVFASFMCNMVVDGISYCFGIFLGELVTHYGVSKGTAAWVGSILVGATMCVGPFVSAFANKFGCRITCISGSVIASIGFILSTYCTSIELLMVCYGLIGGIGFGFIYLPAVVCVGYYFETKRSLATGIAVCGSGVGTFAFAPVARILIDNYGWQKTNLILATVILGCVLFGALMKPLEYSEKNVNIQRNKAASISSAVSNGNARKRNASEGEMATSRLSIASKKSQIQPLARKDIFYSGSILNLKEFQSQKSLNNYRHSIHTIPVLKLKKSHDEHSCLPASLRSVLQPILELLSLFKDPIFMLIAVSNLFGMSALYVPFVYIVDCAVAEGIELSSASSLISVIGIVNTFSRLLCGWIADFPQINTLFVNNICLVLAAISVGIVPYCHTYTAFAGMATLFSISTAGWISLTSIILVDLLGLDKLTNAFGLLILFRGLAAFIGSPLAGVLYDLTHTFSIPFYVATGLFVACAITSFSVASVKTYLDKRNLPVDDEALAPMNTIRNEN